MASEWNNIEFIHLLNSISNRFIAVDIDNIDEAIDGALAAVIDATEVQRGYIFLYSKDRRQLVLAYEVCTPNVTPHRGILESVDVSDLTDFVNDLEQNRDIQVSVSELPDTPENEAMLSILQRLDIKSFINIPMFFEKELIGYIGFDSVTVERDWSDAVRYAFRFTGNTIANVLNRKQQHNLLQRMFAQQKAMLDNLPYNAWLKNAEGRYLAVNKNFLHVVNKQKEEVINRTCYDIFPAEQAKRTETADKKVLEEEQPSVEDELSSFGEDTWYRTYRSPVIGDDGSVIGIAGMSVDITELKRTEENLNRLNEAKNLLFSTLAHDIRSPVIALNSLMNVLLQDEEKLEKEQRTGYYRKLNGQIADTLFLLDNLFQWAQLQQQGIALNRQEVPLSDIIREAVQNVMRQLKEKNLSLERPQPFDFTVFADRNMIVTVLRNVLSNSIKFTPEGGTVAISTGPRKDGEVMLYITDNGIGISEENKQKLLSDEHRISTKGTNNERGSGLGLLLSKTYMEQNEGKISIESVPGKGTKVVLTLPCGE